MSSFLSWALLKGVKGSSSAWVANSPKLIVTVPGYDRHFSLAQSLGYKLLTVPMTPQGPDMEKVEALASSDASINGYLFCTDTSTTCRSQTGNARSSVLHRPRLSGIRCVLTLVLHKIPAQNRFAASIAASKALYSFFLDLT